MTKKLGNENTSVEQSWECQPGVADVVRLCSDDLRTVERSFLEKKVPCSCAVL